MSDAHGKYEHEMPHHDPKEGFDASEPDSKSIFGFVIGSVVLLVAMIFALQVYFDKVWANAVDDYKSVPSGELATQHSLEDWRMTHYEFADKSKSTVRIPMDRAKALLLEEAKAGKMFYPGKATEPKPETPPASVAGPEEGKGEPAAAKGAEKGKQAKALKQENKAKK